MGKKGWLFLGSAVVFAGVVNIAIGFEAVVTAAAAVPWKEVREWVSALAGYFALFAAWLTVREMARQTRESNRHQRENVELQILPRVALARRIADMSGNVADNIPGAIQMIEKIETAQTPQEAFKAAFYAARFFSQIRPEIDLQLVEIYGQETASGRIRNHRFLPQFVRAAMDAHDKLIAAIDRQDEAAIRAEAKRLKDSINGLTHYFGPLRDEALGFCSRWQARIDHDL